jgi:hypothetical protein
MARYRKPEREPEVLRGTRALASFIFGDPNQWRKVYPLAAELGLFRWGGFLCGRPATIRCAIAERERKGRRRKITTEPETRSLECCTT